MIFGSQIRLLRNLNETKQPISDGFVAQYFSVIQQRYSDELSSWTHEQYLEFMLASTLIEKTEAGYVITSEGYEFLIEMTRRGLAEGKGL